MTDNGEPRCPETGCVNARSHAGPHAFTSHAERIAFVRRTATAILAARAAASSATPYDAAALVIRAALVDESDAWRAPPEWAGALDEAEASSTIVAWRERKFTICDGDTGTGAQ